MVMRHLSITYRNKAWDSHYLLGFQFTLLEKYRSKFELSNKSQCSFKEINQISQLRGRNSFAAIVVSHTDALKYWVTSDLDDQLSSVGAMLF